MATILFYEKPGCQNNIRQKKILELSGHIVEPINLLVHQWTTEELGHFLGEKPIAECFNPAAPAIKSGLINPFEFSKEEALEIMIKEPLLIKRPLLKIGNQCIQGFDTSLLQQMINLSPVKDADTIAEKSGMHDLNSCPHIDNTTCINKEH